MTSSSRPAQTRVRILRGTDDGAPAATTVAFGPVSAVAGRHGRVPIEDQLGAARAAGFQEGFQRGMAEAHEGNAAERLAQLRRVADALVEAAGSAAHLRSTAVAEAEREAVRLAFELAEAILQRELSPGTERARDALVRALGLVPVGVDLVVRLHPGDVLDVQELQALVPDAAVKVVYDPSVEEGGCVVDAGPCRIDAQIGSAMERARQVVAAILPATEDEHAGSDESVAGSDEGVAGSEGRVDAPVDEGAVVAGEIEERS